MPARIISAVGDPGCGQSACSFRHPSSTRRQRASFFACLLLIDVRTWAHSSAPPISQRGAAKIRQLSMQLGGYACRWNRDHLPFSMGPRPLARHHQAWTWRRWSIPLRRHDLPCLIADGPQRNSWPDPGARRLTISSPGDRGVLSVPLTTLNRNSSRRAARPTSTVDGDYRRVHQPAHIPSRALLDLLMIFSPIILEPREVPEKAAFGAFFVASRSNARKIDATWAGYAGNMF